MALLFQSLIVSEGRGWVTVRSREWGKSCIPSVNLGQGSISAVPSIYPDGVLPCCFAAATLWPHLLILMRVAIGKLTA